MWGLLTSSGAPAHPFVSSTICVMRDRQPDIFQHTRWTHNDKMELPRIHAVTHTMHQQCYQSSHCLLCEASHGDTARPKTCLGFDGNPAVSQPKVMHRRLSKHCRTL